MQRINSGVAVVSGKIYVVGGESVDNNMLNTVEVYDPATNAWTAAAPMGMARDSFGVAVLGGKIYAAGGYDGDNYLDICLLVGVGDAVPASVDVICGEDTQISMPKGLKKASNGLAPRSAPRCAPHTVSVHARDDAHTGATPFSY